MTTIEELTDRTWPDFEKLFEGRGGPKSCWCMVWRADKEEARNIHGAHRKACMHRRVRSGTKSGIIALVDGEPFGWCSIAPKSKRSQDSFRHEEGGTR